MISSDLNDVGLSVYHHCNVVVGGNKKVDVLAGWIRGVRGKGRGWTGDCLWELEPK